MKSLASTIESIGVAIGAPAAHQETLSAASRRTTCFVKGSVQVVGVGPSWGPTAEEIATAYARAGEHLARDLRGEYAAIVVDRRRGLLIATAALTARLPIAFAATPDGVLVSTHVLALVQCRGAPRTLDDRYLVPVLLGTSFAPPGSTAIRGVERLRPGHALIVEGGEPRSVQVERFVARTLGARDWRSHRDAFRDAVDGAVRRRTTPGARVGLSLSAGIDSVVVAAAIRRVFGHTTAFSMVAPEMPDENEGLATIEASMGDLSIVRVDVSGSFDLSALDSLPLTDDPVLTAAPLFPASLALARAMRAAGFDTVAQGEGGDEIFTASPLYALRAGHLLGAIRAVRAQGLWRPLLWRSLVLPHLPPAMRRGWYRRWARAGHHLPSYAVRSRNNARALASAESLHFDASVHRSMRGAIDLWLSSPLFLGSRLAHERLLEHAGLEVMAPLVDRGVIELAMGTPARWLLWPGHEKGFLRRALEGAVPDSVRMRPKDLRLVRVLLRNFAVAPSSREALANPIVRRRVADWVRLDEVSRIVDAIEAGMEPSWTLLWRLECLICFARWYRRAASEYGIE